MSRPLFCTATLLLVASLGRSASAQTLWTAVTSEEPRYAPALCPTNYAATGASCSGRYCDNIQLACGALPAGTSVVSRSWSPWFSEEGASNLGINICVDGPGFGICESRSDGRNLYYCDQVGPTESVVTGIRCAGSYCDNLSLECSTLAAGAFSACAWTGWFSEEQPPFSVAPGRFVRTVECQGSYCDNKRFEYCELRVPAPQIPRDIPPGTLGP